MTKTFTSDQARLNKNAQIAATKNATKERRAQMKCQVFHLKIVTNTASQQAQHNIKQVFNQAKWLKNHILSLDKVDDYKTSKTVPVKTPLGQEERNLNLLGSQVKQAVFDSIKGDIRALSARKNNGGKVGKLKFTREVRSLNLKQVNSTYRFNKKFNRVKIQGIPDWYYVRGAHQFTNLINYELANAKLIKKADGYYLAVTVYSQKLSQDANYEYDSLGVDFGIKTQLTLSNGSEFDVRIMETERLKRLQRKLQRQKRGSNNSYKTRELLQKEYLKLSNKRDDAANEIVASLRKIAKVVYYQDDNFAAWANKKSFARGGRAVQYGVLGRVKQQMLQSPEKFLKVGRFAPTTKTCICGVKNNNLSLNDRFFNCDTCGYFAARDVHAAQNMKIFYSPGESGGALVEGESDSSKLLFSVKQETDNFTGYSSEAAKSSA